MEKRRIMYSQQLIQKSKECLADTFLMYMKAHSYHWNVVGSDFAEFHEFFGNLYEELHGSVDVLAEQIRTLESYAPFSLLRMVELSNVTEDQNVVSLEVMIDNLIEANTIVVNTLTESYLMAEKEKAFSYSNFLQDRLTAHAKHAWMLRAIKGKQ